MFDITLLAMGKLKEPFYLSAAAEYAKRLGGYCKFTLLELPEVRLPENPSPAEIASGLEKEADTILAKIPKSAWFCVFTPEGENAFQRGLCGHSEKCEEFRQKLCLLSHRLLLRHGSQSQGESGF